MTPQGDAARATEVYRRWRRTSLDVMSRASWEGWTLHDSGFIVSLTCMILLLILEPALWLKSWPPPLLPLSSYEWFAPSLLVMPLHGWLLDRFLSAKTPAERFMPRWLLALRFITASFPLLSFCLLPAWRIFLERRPSWTSPPSHPRLDMAQGAHRSSPSGRLLGVYTSGIFGVLMAIGFALPVIWSLWLARTATLDAARPVVLAACAAIHLIAFAAARFAVAPLRGLRTVTVVVPWLYLLPIPAPLLGAMLLAYLETSASGKDALTWSTWARRGTASHLPRWLQAEETLRSHWTSLPWFRQWRRPWQIDRQSRDGELDQDLLSLYRRKIALLPLEGGAATAGLSILVEFFPYLGPGFHTTVRLTMFAGVIFAGIGLALLATAAVVRVLRISRLSSSGLAVFARYLLLAPAAFLAGAYGGLLWTEGRERELGLLVGYSGALLAIFAWMFFLPSVSQGSGVRMGALWGLLFLSLALLGIPIGLNSRFGGWPGRLFATAALLTPLWGLLLFCRFGHWLPRPFLWRDHARLPGRLRAVLAFLKWTAILPGGGLAIPAWIVLRGYLRRQYVSFIADPCRSRSQVSAGPSPAKTLRGRKGA